jgi:hypothetical protein
MEPAFDLYSKACIFPLQQDISVTLGHHKKTHGQIISTASHLCSLRIFLLLIGLYSVLTKYSNQLLKNNFICLMVLKGNCLLSPFYSDKRFTGQFKGKN